MPDWKRIVRERIGTLGLTPGAEGDLVEEVAQHLEDRYRELTSGGATEEEGRGKVLAELEDTYRLRFGVRRSERLPKRDAVPAGDAKQGSFFADMGRDLRYAVRGLRRSPVFVLFVVVTLALGIGANTTVFTMINTLILNPLPVRNMAELGAVAATDVSSKATTAAMFPMSYADLKDYQARNRAFESLAGYSSAYVLSSLEQGSAQMIFAELVTGNYFATLGLAPVRGRFFLPEEDGAAGAHAVAVINYKTWQIRFGGEEDIIGKTFRLNNQAYTVIGVAPPGFIGVNAIFGPDLWIPAAMAEILVPNQMRNGLSDRSKTAFFGVGRYRAGAGQARAQANLASIASELAREFPATNEGHTVAVKRVREVVFGSARGAAEQIAFAGAALLIVVGIILLIACSNVANLLLARSASRGKEMAVRLAMGASRARLVRQLLTESVLLGLLSGAAGLLLGYAGLQLVFGMFPGSANFPAPKLDATVFLFALMLSLATGFLFGTIPALKASRASVAERLKEEARTTGASPRRVTVARALLVGQVALSFVLLVTAALFLRSIGRAYNMDPGFQTAHLAVFPASASGAGYGKPQTKGFYKEARERVEGVPGVESAAWASNLPLWARPANGLEIEGRQQRSRADTIRTIVTAVETGYFQTAGVAIVSGRVFGSQDQENSAPVAIVNQKLAQDYWGGAALGKRIRLPDESRMRVIVGIARTANYGTWGEAPQPCVYVPSEQKYSESMTLFVRSRRSPQEIMIPVEREVRAAGPQVLVTGVRTGRELIDGGLFQARMGVTMLSVFGLLALGLASVGLYGILAYSVTQRRREIGLRMALGATRGGVLRLVLKQGMSLVAVGLAIGFGASLMAGRLLSRMLYGVTASDPASVAAAAAMLSTMALLACYLPARGATRVDPVEALHEQ